MIYPKQNYRTHRDTHFDLYIQYILVRGSRLLLYFLKLTQNCICISRENHYSMHTARKQKCLNDARVCVCVRANTRNNKSNVFSYRHRAAWSTFLVRVVNSEPKTYGQQKYVHRQTLAWLLRALPSFNRCFPTIITKLTYIPPYFIIRYVDYYKQTTSSRVYFCFHNYIRYFR